MFPLHPDCSREHRRCPSCKRTRSCQNHNGATRPQHRMLDRGKDLSEESWRLSCHNNQRGPPMIVKVFKRGCPQSQNGATKLSVHCEGDQLTKARIWTQWIIHGSLAPSLSQTVRETGESKNTRSGQFFAKSAKGRTKLVWESLLKQTAHQANMATSDDGCEIQDVQDTATCW